MMQALSRKSLPLNSNRSWYALNTRDTRLTGYLTIPTLDFGQNWYIKDGSDYMSQSQTQIQRNNSILLATGLSTLTMNLNSESKHLVYTGAGTGGMLLQL